MSVAQQQTDVNLLQIGPATWIVVEEDGVYPPIDESGDCPVVLDGIVIAWAHESRAQQIYSEALRQRHEHFKRCPEDFIPFRGEPIIIKAITEVDTYGLKARS